MYGLMRKKDDAMHRRWIFVLLLLPFLLAACNLTTSQNIETATPTMNPNSGSPIVTLTSPADGAQVKVNELVLVRGVASDAVGVTSIRLLANGQPVQSKGFNGEKNVNFTLDYTPVSRGEVTLTVLAFRNTVQVIRSRLKLASDRQVYRLPALPLSA